MTRKEFLRRYQWWIDKNWPDMRTDANKSTEFDKDLREVIKDEIKKFVDYNTINNPNIYITNEFIQEYLNSKSK